MSMSPDQFNSVLLWFFGITVGGTILCLLIYFLVRAFQLWNVFRENRKRLESAGKDLQAAEDRLAKTERDIKHLREHQHHVSHHQARCDGIKKSLVTLRAERSNLSEQSQKEGWQSALSFDVPIHFLKGHAENLFVELNLIDDSLANDDQPDQVGQVLRAV